jgi:hypothetical protein
LFDQGWLYNWGLVPVRIGLSGKQPDTIDASIMTGHPPGLRPVGRYLLLVVDPIHVEA